MSKAPAPFTVRDVTVREARADDFVDIQALYAHEVLFGTATFETTPPTVDMLQMRWWESLSLELPYLVALKRGLLIGYAYATAYRARPAYRFTAESSVYVASEHHGQGVGRTLLTRLIGHCRLGQTRQVIAVIGGSDNAGSIALHTSVGFLEAGRLRDVGYKHGRWLDTVIMQHTL